MIENVLSSSGFMRSEAPRRIGHGGASDASSKDGRLHRLGALQRPRHPTASPCHCRIVGWSGGDPLRRGARTSGRGPAGRILLHRRRDRPGAESHPPLPYPRRQLLIVGAVANVLVAALWLIVRVYGSPL